MEMKRSEGRWSMLHGETGGAGLVAVVVMIVLSVVMASALDDLGSTTVDRARAQTAADAAALAGLRGGHTMASSIAARHGAVLVTWAHDPASSQVTVSVRFGEIAAVARATDAP